MCGRLGHDRRRHWQLRNPRLTAAERRRLPKRDFGLPKERKYPEQDRRHAGLAKGRAKLELRRGVISRAEYDEIVRKANKVLYG
ncbi:MAG: hypothetical protein KGL39_12030 [Patescibacteria group bacterium]|nr:hypothetical protein [Patescibacteria group bacterium]